MNPSEQFRRFAAECEAMSKFAESRRTKLLETGWQQNGFCSPELADDRYSPKINTIPRRRRFPSIASQDAPDAASPAKFFHSPREHTSLCRVSDLLRRLMASPAPPTKPSSAAVSL